MKDQTIFKAFFYVILSFLSMTQLSYAEHFDQNYLKWKAEQQTQDAKLKQNTDPNYYLSKPSLSHTTKSKSNSGQAVASTGSKISLNSASLEQLQQLNGVGLKKAQAILDYRNQNGKFNSIDDLQKVKGIGPKLLEKNKAILSL
ncbi:ComEA family DNA-binding protein [Acinetobacter sp. ANC 3832]|uniref:ComEA family DNA-binding protein n=1 Tax=Acinetobacter sp. ANC 3832 TaxID=1977874 RepID=UPI000A34A53B|nr:ComEA family DNA-binding protein [Acinetobacter sp. ANC 3832]OTG94176.1 hypothetical protein B9T35_07135 [Acinetobacter sp. ANC 3832]